MGWNEGALLQRSIDVLHTPTDLSHKIAMARGGKGGKGPKPTFTRVIPKFLQQYETMLTGPKPEGGPDDEAVFSGGGDFTDGAGGGSASGRTGMPGRGRGRRDEGSNQGGGGGEGGSRGGGSEGGGSGSGGVFGDYDEEEVAALEAYMKTHPSKEEDREALRRRAKELSASIGSGKVSDAKSGGTAAGTGGAAGAGSADVANKAPPPPEEPIEYTDASGKLKFNKRSAAVRSGGTADSKGDSSKVSKKRAKRAKLVKLDNANLLSFGDDEDG